MQNLLLKWLQENFTRLSTKSPLFFKIWMGVSGALVLITWLPDLLLIAKIDIGPVFSEHMNIAVKWASTGIFWMSLLSTQSQPVAVSNSGDLLEKKDEKKLPFTTKVEENKAGKEGGVLHTNTPTEKAVVTAVENKVK